MDTLNISLDKRYTYADYLIWLDDKRRELINGFVHLITPAPAMKHQKISRQILYFLWKHLSGKSCEVFSAPFDVRLPSTNKEKADGNIFTVVQPDLCVVCDLSKLMNVVVLVHPI